MHYLFIIIVKRSLILTLAHKILCTANGFDRITFELIQYKWLSWMDHCVTPVNSICFMSCWWLDIQCCSLDTMELTAMAATINISNGCCFYATPENFAWTFCMVPWATIVGAAPYNILFLMSHGHRSQFSIEVC